MSDPFLAAQSALHQALSPPPIKGEYFQLRILSALLGFALFLQILSVGIRWKKGMLWLMRRQEGWICPAGVNCWLVISIVFSIAVQPVCPPPASSSREVM